MAFYRCHAAKRSQPGLFGGCRDQSVGLEIARNDPRVVSMEQFNFRYAEPDDFEATPSFASIDVSFISLDLILPALHRIFWQKMDKS